MKCKVLPKLLISVLILTLLFSSYSNAATSKSVNMHLILGSTDYVSKIRNIYGREGYKRALSEIIADVDKYGTELDKNDPANIIRLYKLVSFVIGKIGHVDMETHYFRNKLNRTPKSLSELIALNKTLPVKKRWILINVANSAYHMQGSNGEFNLKFVSYNGFCEAVYNKKGELLSGENDPVNMGTFNFSPGISGIGNHKKYDVAPYLLWGNTADISPEALAGTTYSVNAGTINCRIYAKDISIYRKNLFGMQAGKVI